MLLLVTATRSLPREPATRGDVKAVFEIATGEELLGLMMDECRRE